MRGGTSLWPIWLLSIGLAIFGVIVLYLLYIAFQQVETTGPQELLWVEIGKTVLQVIGVVVLGNLVSYAYKKIEAGRDETRRLNAYRETVLVELRRAYDAVKRARRLLRAEGLSTRYGPGPTYLNSILATKYKGQMIALLDAQLALEDVKTRLMILPDDRGRVEARSKVKEMDEYVGCIIAEFEKYFPSIKSNPDEFIFAKLTRLIDLTGCFGGSAFRSKVSEPFADAVKALEAEILGKSHSSSMGQKAA